LAVKGVRGDKATPLKKTVDVAIEGAKAHDWPVQVRVRDRYDLCNPPELRVGCRRS
jgi:hypothetical protein